MSYWLLNFHLLLSWQVIVNRFCIRRPCNFNVIVDDKIHVFSLVRVTFEAPGRESIKIDRGRVFHDLVRQSLDAIEELLVCLTLLTISYLLLEYWPELAENGSRHELSWLILTLNATIVDLSKQVGVLRPHHLELELVLGIGVQVICRLWFNLLRFADDSVFEDAFAEDRIEIIVVKLISLFITNCCLDILLCAGYVLEHT